MTIDQLFRVHAIQSVELQAHKEAVAELQRRLTVKEAELENARKLLATLKGEEPSANGQPATRLAAAPEG